MLLEPWPELPDPARVAQDYGVGIAYYDLRQLDPVDELRLPHLDGTELRLVEDVPCPSHLHAPRPDMHAGPRRSGAAHQPGRCDARAVAGHLGARPVRIDDADRDIVALDREHLDRSICPG